jgi:hypothetical protein
VFLFRGVGKGEYAVPTKLTYAAGGPVNAGHASAVAVADWNRDGLLDLVIGNLDGEVWFVPNVTSDGKLAFGSNMKVLVGRSRIRVTGDAGPFVADWDGNGIPDLLLGASDGSVTFYRGSGKEGVPTLEEAGVLIPPLPEDMSHATTIQYDVDPNSGHLRMPALTRPWIRTKPAVHDWNGDGRLDLLVGDFAPMTGPEPRLTDAQQKERDELENKLKRVNDEISKRHSKARNDARREVESGKASPDRRDGSEWLEEKANEILRGDQQYLDLVPQAEAIRAKLKPFQAEFSIHGFVWVYLRTSPTPVEPTKRNP